MKRQYWLALAAAIGFAGSAFADIPIDKSFSAEPNGSVQVECVKGTVVIEGWDRNEFHVTGTQGNGVERIDYETEDGDLAIKVVYPKRSRGGDTVLNIKAPMGNEGTIEVVSAKVVVTGLLRGVAVKGVSGRVDVSGCEGPVHVKTVSGSVYIDSPASEVAVGTVSGSIQINNAMGDVHTETVSGSTQIESNHLRGIDCESVSSSIRIKGGFDPAGELELESHSGSIQISGGPIKDLRAETMSSSIKVETELLRGGEVELGSFSGSVNLYIPAGTEAEYSLESFSGSVNLKGMSVAEAVTKSGRKTGFVIGSDPELEIEMRSFSGSVNIEGKVEN